LLTEHQLTEKVLAFKKKALSTYHNEIKKLRKHGAVDAVEEFQAGRDSFIASLWQEAFRAFLTSYAPEVYECRYSVLRSRKSKAEELESKALIQEEINTFKANKLSFLEDFINTTMDQYTTAQYTGSRRKRARAPDDEQELAAGLGLPPKSPRVAFASPHARSPYARAAFPSPGSVGQGFVVPDSLSVSSVMSFDGWTPEQIIQYQSEQNKSKELEITQTYAQASKEQAIANREQAEANKEQAEANKRHVETIKKGIENHSFRTRQMDEYKNRNTEVPVAPKAPASAKAPSASASSGGFLHSAYNGFGLFRSSPSTTRPQMARPEFQLGNWFIATADLDVYSGLLNQFLDHTFFVWKEHDYDHAKDVSIRFLSFLFGTHEHRHQMSTFLDNFPRRGELLGLLKTFGWSLPRDDPTLRGFVERYIRSFQVGTPIKYRKVTNGKIEMIDAVIAACDVDFLTFGTFKIDLGDRERDTGIERILPMGSIDEFLRR